MIKPAVFAQFPSIASTALQTMNRFRSVSRQTALGCAIAAISTCAVGLVLATGSTPMMSSALPGAFATALDPVDPPSSAPTPDRMMIRAARGQSPLGAIAPTQWRGAETMRAARGERPRWVRFDGPLPPETLAKPTAIETAARMIDDLVTVEIASLTPIEPTLDAWGVITRPTQTGAPSRLPRSPKLRPPGPLAPASAAADAPPRGPLASPPEIVIVLTAVGVNPSASAAALDRLPPEIAVAVAPIVDDPSYWIAAARRTGRIGLLELPMEPTAYPRVDPGPLTLLRDAPAEVNLAKIDATLALAPQADGVATYLGGGFLSDPTAVGPVADELRRRELFLLDAGGARRSIAADVARSRALPFAAATLSLDNFGRSQDIEAQLAELERVAREAGRAVGVAVAIPSTVAAIEAWVDGLEGVRLSPLQPS